MFRCWPPASTEMLVFKTPKTGPALRGLLFWAASVVGLVTIALRPGASH
jgi:hypothetical protein